MKNDNLQTRVERAVRKRKLRNVFVMLLLVMVVFTSLSMLATPAEAACSSSSPCDGCEGTTWLSYREDIEDDVGGIGPAAFDVATIACNCNPHFNFSTIAGTIYKFSSYNGKWLGDKSADTSLIAAGAAMYQVMEVVGLCLIFLFFLIDLLDEVQADSFTIEHLIKKLLTLTVAIIVMQMGEEIFSLICEMGDTLIDDAAKAVGDGNVGALTRIYDTLMDLAEEDGLFSSIIAFLGCLAMLVEQIVPYILMLVALIIAYLVGFSRFIEILTRFAFAPIGIAQLVSGGAKGPGMRYIKKFASVVIQGAVAVLAFGTVTIISNAAAGINAILASILVPITLIGFLMKIGRVADDIMGV